MGVERRVCRAASAEERKTLNILRRAPKAAIKRVFLITDEDDPHPGAKSAQLITSAQTTLLVRCPVGKLNSFG